MEQEDNDLEFEAMRQVYAALKGLDMDARSRVLDYVARRLSLKWGAPADTQREREAEERTEPRQPATEPEADTTSGDDDVEGVSPIAKKWMRRSQLSGKQLSSLYSLGIDEIDLVAKTVPGKSKVERVRSVALLMGIAGYLSSGVARVADEKLREVCGHYDAYDGTNFSKQLKAMAAEIGGNKEGGYTLTSRGLTAATELIKTLVAQ